MVRWQQQADEEVRRHGGAKAYEYKAAHH